MNATKYQESIKYESNYRLAYNTGYRRGFRCGFLAMGAVALVSCFVGLLIASIL